MLVTFVHVHVEEDHIDEFIEACRLNHEGSIQEPGNRRFDINQSAEDPAYFILYESYESEESVLAHKETDHYKKWRETVDGWMTQRRQGIKFKGLYPK